MFIFAPVAVPYVYEGHIRAGNRLSIGDINGSVRVRTGDRLVVRAVKSATHGDPNAVVIRVDQRPDGVVVCVRYPPETNLSCDNGTSQNSTTNGTRVDFDVTVPRGVALRAATVNGTVDAHVDGNVELASIEGRVSYQGSGTVRIDTVNGPVIVRETGGSGSVAAKNVSGSIDVTVPSGAGVSLRARTLSGGITAPGFSVDRPQYGLGATVDGRAGNGALSVNLETVSGSIRLRR